jgi:hypothetical protein
MHLFEHQSHRLFFDLTNLVTELPHVLHNFIMGPPVCIYGDTGGFEVNSAMTPPSSLLGPSGDVVFVDAQASVDSDTTHALIAEVNGFVAWQI